MLKLISGTLVGGVNYSDLYIDSDDDEDTSFTSSFVNENDKEHSRKKNNVKYQHCRKLHEKWQGLRRHNWMKNNILHMK